MSMALVLPTLQFAASTLTSCPDEYVLDTTARVSDGIMNTNDAAPQPLLANYGVGRSRRYTIDVLMMCMFNGGERTLQDYIDMG